MAGAEAPRDLRVRVDQGRCTGDGLCAAMVPEVFEFDDDGLAYVKDAAGTLLTAEDASTPVPNGLDLDVIDAARDCPGECIHVVGAGGEPVAGPDAWS